MISKIPLAKAERSICFYDIILYIQEGKVLDIFKHPHTNKYPGPCNAGRKNLISTPTLTHTQLTNFHLNQHALAGTTNNERIRLLL